MTGWGSYRFQNWLSGSLRLSYVDLDSISGRDSAIGAPVQTANPDNYGGERVDLRQLDHNGPEYIDTVAMAMKAAFADRNPSRGL